jgi:hypothetical protein
MNKIIPFDAFNESQLNEDTPNVSLATEKTNQAKIQDQIKIQNGLMAKIDDSNKKQADKDNQKAKIMQTIGQLTVTLGQSMLKQASFMQAIAKQD